MIKTHVRNLAALCFLIALPTLARGQVLFSEIMYDVEGADTGREWIEVQNTGEIGVDLTTWRLFEANSNHKISAVGEAVLQPQGFAIIADNPEKFKADNPQFAGLLYDSAFSLSNDGETIVLRSDGLADIDTVTYVPAVGAAGDGTSLQKIASGWISAMPTPGSLTTATESYHPVPPINEDGNSGPVTPPEDSDDRERGGDPGGKRLSDYSAHSGQAAATVSYDIPEFQVTGGRARLGFVGAPLFFEAKVKAAKNLLSGALGADWSMGDGTERAGQTIQHAYQFAGDYIVILNASLGGMSAVSKIQVKIADPAVEIASSPSGYFEVSNISDFELNIGGWILETEASRSILPRDTIVQPRSSVRLPIQTMGMLAPSEYVRLANPSGKIVARSEAVSQPIETLIVLPEGVSAPDLISRLEAIIAQ